MNIDRYKVLKKDKLAEYNTKKVPTFVPNPIDIDYKRGYIKRYFIQKSNDDI